MEVLKHLHTSVAQAFDASFDDAYRELNTELTRRDVRVKAVEREAAAANEARINAAAKSEKLEHEVRILREELRHHQVDSKELEVSATKSHGMWEAYAPGRVLESCTIGDKDNLHPDLIEYKKTVDARYRALYGEAQTLINVLGELRTQVKRHKRKLMRWQDYIARDEFTLALDGSLVTFQRVPAAANGDQMKLRMSKPRPSTPEPLETVRGTTAVDASTSNLELSQSTPDANYQEPETIVRADGRHSDGLSELPSTPSDRSQGNEVESNDLAVAVARPPKRKLPSAQQPHLTSACSHRLTNDKPPPPPIVVKNEPMSSSPPGIMSQFFGPNPPATQDLDEVGGTVETPTKRKGNNPEQAPHISAVTTAASRQSGGLEDAHYDNSRLSPGRQVSGIPQPGDGHHRNANCSRRRLNGEPSRRLKRVVQQGLHSIAEDGDDSYFDIGPRKRQQKSLSNANAEQLSPGTNNSYAQRRLQHLLENRVPSRSPLNVLRKSSNTVTTGRNPSRNLDDLIDQSSPTVNVNPASKVPREMETMRNDLADGGGSRLDNIKTDFPETRPEDEPYRTRPLHRLGLSHFKINPDNNEGLDYAFNEVVRKKDERKGISGCTRADCCGGKFLAMARLGGLPAELRRSLQEDPRSLEDHLGDEQHSLGMPDGGDKDGLPPGVRTIANCYGKHRHDHQRPHTPPGFWRTEMPSTQDLERDREEARRQERETVKERYREAMRPGGLWKYADE